MHQLALGRASMELETGELPSLDRLRPHALAASPVAAHAAISTASSNPHRRRSRS